MKKFVLLSLCLCLVFLVACSSQQPASEVNSLTTDDAQPSDEQVTDDDAIEMAYTIAFEDDFSTWEGWNNYKDGTVEHDTEMFKTGGGSLKKDNNGDPHGGWKLLDAEVGRNFILEGFIYRPFLELGIGGRADRIAVVDSNYNGYGFIVYENGYDPGYMDIEVREEGWGFSKYVEDGSLGGYFITSDVSISDQYQNVRVYDQWYRFVFQAFPDYTFKLSFYDQNDALIAEAISKADDSFRGPFDRITVQGGFPYYVDSLIIYDFD
jgi:hypothetical protein